MNLKYVTLAKNLPVFLYLCRNSHHRMIFIYSQLDFLLSGGSSVNTQRVLKMSTALCVLHQDFEVLLVRDYHID